MQSVSIKRSTLLVVVLALVAVLMTSMLPVTAYQGVVEDTARFQAEDLTDLYDRVSPSVVAISVFGTRTDPMTGEEVPGGGSGSGFVLDTDGHIITNNHVVEGGDRIEVEFFNGTLALATVVGLDPNSDLAVIRVEGIAPENLFPVEFADTDELRVGQPVLAIGNPFGREWTLTSGIISALDRTISGLNEFSVGDVIQTDAAINPGNSGGPLLDMNGRVIGVNSQIISRSGASAGVGFAVPGNLTQRVSRELIDQGYVEYSYLGISGGDATLALLESLGLPNDTQGVVVSEAVAGGPAARAGLMSAGEPTEYDGIPVPETVDIITAIDGTNLRGIGDLISYLAQNTRPGDTVTLSVLRDGTESLEIDVRLTPR